MLFKMLFSNKKQAESDRESDFQIVMDIVKRFDKTEFRRFIEGVELSWQGYDKILRVQTREEKEVKPVNEVEGSFIETKVNE